MIDFLEIRINMIFFLDNIIIIFAFFLIEKIFDIFFLSEKFNSRKNDSKKNNLLMSHPIQNPLIKIRQLNA